ncbi:hypothetical protein CRENBAI_010261 [Crenichthys baileyi]|uniref:Uncharacterized protein n=1 Tax=Crenichthys baileyi TaxID=28760 RepID=A0AAV9R3Y2_9TELE
MQLNRPRSTLLGVSLPAPSFSSQFSTMRFSYHLHTAAHNSAIQRTGEFIAAFVSVKQGSSGAAACFLLHPTWSFTGSSRTWCQTEVARPLSESAVLEQEHMEDTGSSALDRLTCNKVNQEAWMNL